MNLINLIHLQTSHKANMNPITSMSTWAWDTYKYTIINGYPLRTWWIAFNAKIIHIFHHFLLSTIQVAILTINPIFYMHWRRLLNRHEWFILIVWVVILSLLMERLFAHWHSLFLWIMVITAIFIALFYLLPVLLWTFNICFKWVVYVILYLFYMRSKQLLLWWCSISWILKTTIIIILILWLRSRELWYHASWISHAALILCQFLLLMCITRILIHIFLN